MKDNLLALLDNAYTPYSHYKVAASVEMKDGHIFYGVNVENASFSASICAERSAIFNAVTNGYKKGDFKALYLINDNDKLAYPCEMCLQVISEFFETDADIILYTTTEEKKVKVKDLIPHPFTKEDLPL